MTGKENQHEILDYKLNILAAKNDITGDDVQPQSFWRSGAVSYTHLDVYKRQLLHFAPFFLWFVICLLYTSRCV